MRERGTNVRGFLVGDFLRKARLGKLAGFLGFRFVNVYVNEEDIRFLKNRETPLKDGDEISIIPAIAGG